MTAAKDAAEHHPAFTKPQAITFLAMAVCSLVATGFWLMGGDAAGSPLTLPTDALQFATGILFTGLHFSVYRKSMTAVRRVLLAAFALYTGFAFFKLITQAWNPDFGAITTAAMLGFFLFLATAGVMALAQKLKRAR